MQNRRFYLLLVVLVLLTLSSCGSKEVKDTEDEFEVTADTMNLKVTPEIKGTITDYEKLFTERELKMLQDKCAAFEKKDSIPAAVFTCDNIGDFNTYTEYADAVSGKWNGCKNEQGILFVISNKLGEVRMISCPATESFISDEDFDYVINTIIFESFRKSQFCDGIVQALDYLDQKIKK